MKQRKRNVKLWSGPTVTHSTHAGPNIEVTVIGSMGADRAVCIGNLSPHCARTLILKLRQALRAIRAEQKSIMDEAIADAEKPL